MARHSPWAMPISLLATAALTTLGCDELTAGGSLEHGTPEIHSALVDLEPVDDSGASGSAKLTQASGVSGPKIRDRSTKLTVSLIMDGHAPDGTYFAAVHGERSCGGPGASEAGDRYDPEGDEGAGELGQFRLDDGQGELKGTQDRIAVKKGATRSVLGRALVVRNEAGERVACGIIRPRSTR